MGRWGGLQDWYSAQTNPAAPAGLQADARAAHQYQETGSTGGRWGGLGQFVTDQGYMGAAQTWYTGANPTSTQNGWDDKFFRQSIRAQQEALDAGKGQTQFDNPEWATGVITYDHESEDGRTSYHFGDVYEKGKKTGNVFKDYGRDSGNLMMAAFLLDPKTQAETFDTGETDPEAARKVISERLRPMMVELREQGAQIAADTQSSHKFNTDVDERAKEFEEGWVDEGSIGAATLGGALLGGGAGSAFGPVGTVLGGLGGGAVSGLAAWANQDQITYNAARAYEITALSNKVNGRAAAISTGIQQFSGFGGQLIVPMQNIVQGYADVSRGDVGDGVSEFYRTDKTGERVVPNWLKVANFAATIGDSALQFASPVGVALYTAQMTGQISGAIGERVLSGNQFDYSSGQYESAFFDDEGNFDASKSAAGLGVIAIDAVQLGMVRGLAGKVDALRLSTGKEAVYLGGRTMTSRITGGKLTGWPGIGGSRTRYLGGSTAAQREAVEEGAEWTERGAYKYLVKKDKKTGEETVIGPRKGTVGLLAPSEQLGALSNRVVAMRMASRKSGNLTSDDFYKAAATMASGERKIQTALVNGAGEAYEEGVQLILEQHATDQPWDAEAIFSAAAAGFAGGFGMGLGFNTRMPTADAQMSAQARNAHAMRTGQVMDSGEWNRMWNAMSPTEKRKAAALSNLEAQTVKAAYKKLAKDQALEVNAGVVGANRLHDAVASELSKQLRGAVPRTDGTFVVTQIEEPPILDEEGNIIEGMPSDAIGSSAFQTLQLLLQRMNGIQQQLRGLEQERDTLAAKLEEQPSSEQIAQDVAANTKLLTETEHALKWGLVLTDKIAVNVDRMYDAKATTATVFADSEALNQILRDLFHMRASRFDNQTLSDADKVAIAKAISMTFTRYPQDQAGSYQVLVPQVSAKLTWEKEQGHNLLQISHAILPAISGDFDGDRVQPLNQIILDEEQWISARSGAHFVGVGTSVNVKPPSYEEDQIELMEDSITSGNTTLKAFATGTVTDICDAIQNRYDSVVPTDVLQEALDKFSDAVNAGDKSARAAVLDTLAEKAGTEMNEFARGNVENEWLWVDQVIRANFDRFQRAYASHRPSPDPQVDNTIEPEKREELVRERKAANASVPGFTLSLQAVGVSMFRKFQKLHYSAMKSKTLSAKQAQSRLSLTEQAELYAEISSMETESAMEAVMAKDEITARVMVWLKALALDAQVQLDGNLEPIEAMLVVANMKVQSLKVDIDGQVTDELDGAPISLAQMLLKQSIAIDRQKKDSIFDMSPELQRKHARLTAMTKPNSKKGGIAAERAFVEIFGAEQMYSLLGDDSYIFGPHLTLEQWIRDYVSRSEYERKDERTKLRGEAAYLGRKQSRNMPYDLNEVVNKEDGIQISAFRSVVDAAVAVGSGRITMAKDGTLSGEYADRSDASSEEFWAAHTSIRSAIYEFLEISPEKKVTKKTLQRMMEANPQFARYLLNSVPDSAVQAAFTTVDGKVYAANWIYETFVISDPVEAEMHYWRNVMLAEWAALGVADRVNEEGEIEGQKGREYHRLKSRMHQVMWQLAASGDRFAYEKFIKKLEKADNLKSFMSWLNREPGMRGEQAPLVAWVDEVSAFAPDQADGGWTTGEGTSLREGIANLQLGATNLVRDLVEERQSIEADKQVLFALERVIKFNEGGPDERESGDQTLFDNFEAALDEASKTGISLGPAAMVYQSIGAARGFYPNASAKGQTPDYIDIQGQHDALRDAYDYVTNYERAQGYLTATNLEAVGGQMGEVARDGGQSMDEMGREVTWERPSVKDMVGLLSKTETRATARAIMWPQTMERTFDGRMTTQMLVGKSLADLLGGKSYNNLMAKKDKLRQDKALQYCVAVETHARRYGGHFSLQRAVNDIVIARTSAADHVLSTQELEALVIKTYHDVARILQKTGALSSKADKTGENLLDGLLEESTKSQKVVALGRRLGLSKDDQKITDEIVEAMLKERKMEALKEKEVLQDQAIASTNPMEVDELTDQMEQIDYEIERHGAKMKLLLDDDLAGQAMGMWGYDPKADDETKRARQKVLADYVQNNLGLLEQASTALATMQKLTQQMLDDGRRGQLNLTDEDWSEISNSVVSLFIAQTMLSPGQGVAVAPYPDADHEDNRRYYDVSFSYLVKPLLEQDSPLVQAAAHISNVAGRYGDGENVKKSDVHRVIGQTIFADRSLGAWTPDIPTASIEANERLDSASAESAVGMAGNSPKRQAVISAATRRTDRLPTAEELPNLLSRVSLTTSDIEADTYDEIEVTLPGAGGKVKMPLAQFNNRFAATVVMHYKDPANPDGEPITVNLLAKDLHLGRPFAANEIIKNSGFESIHMDRMQLAIERVMRDRNIGKDQILTVDVEFFHPDSQPVETAVEAKQGKKSWYNNILFEGTSFLLDADRHGSLNSTLWFANDSINPAAQRAALDAAKLGTPAKQDAAMVNREARLLMETGFLTNFSDMLRQKTKALMHTNMGTASRNRETGELEGGYLQPEMYNAVYKNMKLRHYVRGKDPDTGETVVWTAEQVIAFQSANPGTALPITDPQLWIPSDAVLRSLLGERGESGKGMGVPRIFEGQLEPDLSQIPRWTGVTAGMIAQFRKGFEGETRLLSETSVRNRARQQTLVVRPYMSDALRSQYDARMRYFAERRDNIHAERTEWAGKVEKDGWRPKRNLKNFREAADAMLRAENIAFDWAPGGVMFFGPRKPIDTNLSKKVLHNTEQHLQSDGSVTGWIYREGVPSDVKAGLLTENSLSEKKRPGAMHVAPGDPVLIDLDSMNGDLKRMEERAQWFADRGAVIVLSAGTGTWGRPETAEFLESLDYEHVPGSGHVYVPMTSTSNYQNVRARTGTLSQVEGVAPMNHIAALWVKGWGIGENAGWVNGDNPRLRSIKVESDLVPTSAFAGYNAPVNQFTNESQIEEVKRQLKHIDTPEGLAHLCEAQNSWINKRKLYTKKQNEEARKKADDDTKTAFKKMLQWQDNNPGIILPAAGQPFATGDMIPLIDKGNPARVLIYQHGKKAPSVTKIKEQAASVLPGEEGSVNVSIYTSQPNPQHTTHKGKVIRFKPRSGYGLSVEMEVPLSVFGDKKVLQWNGMKLLMTPKPDRVRLPKKGFFPEWGIDIIANMRDLVSKESTEGLVNNHRNAFAYFGMNFLPDVAAAFNTTEDTAYELLDLIASNVNSIPLEAVDELINLPRLNRAFQEFLVGTADEFNDKVDKGWLDRISNPTTVQEQITSAIVTYLASPNARTEDVIKSGGFNDTSSDPSAQSRKMPRVFTQFFDLTTFGSELRLEMNRRFNAQLQGVDEHGEGYTIAENFDFTVHNGGATYEEDIPYVPDPPTEGWTSLLRTLGKPLRERADAAEWVSDMEAMSDDQINTILHDIDSISRAGMDVEDLADELMTWQRSAVRTGEFKGSQHTIYDKSDPRYGRVATQAGSSELANALHRAADYDRHYLRRAWNQGGFLPGVSGRDFIGDRKRREHAVTSYTDHLATLMPQVARSEIKKFVAAAGAFISGHGSVNAVPGTGIEQPEFDILRQLVDNAPIVDHTLYRGLARPPTFDANGVLQGSTAQLASWTAEPMTAAKFGDKHVVKVNGGQALDIGALGGMSEYLMKGTFTLVRQYPDPAHPNITIYEVKQTSQQRAVKLAEHPDITGLLQFAEAHSSGDNPITNGMVFDEMGMQDISQHSAATTYQATGGRTPYPMTLGQYKHFTEPPGLKRFGRDQKDGGAWALFNDIDPSPGVTWRRATPAEAARKNMARMAVTQFRQPIRRDKKRGWDDDTNKKYDDFVDNILQELHIPTKQRELVDYWVRQMLGAPEGRDEKGKDVGWVGAEAAIKTAEEILFNVNNRYFPTVSAMVPLMHVHDVQLIYRLNNKRSDGWKPVSGIDKSSDVSAEKWSDWLNISLGSVLLSDNLFDPLYLLALDGMMHSYQNATRTMLDLPVSFNALVSQELMDPETNRMLVSLDTNTDLLAKDPILLETTKITLEQLIGGSRLATGFQAKAAPASEIAKRREMIRQWRKETGSPVPVPASSKNLWKNGSEFVDKATSTHVFWRFLVNMRVGTALINPALWISMGPEMWVRGSLDRISNMLTGQGTVGRTAKTQASLTDRAIKKRETKRKALEADLKAATTPEERQRITEELQQEASVSALEALGFTHRYSRNQLTRLNDLFKIMGDRNDFNAMIYQDLWFRRPYEVGGGKIFKLSEKYAQFGTRMQDPTHGMSSRTMARRYVEGAMQHLEATPTLDVISVDQLIGVLSTDPAFLQKHHPEAHKAGANAVAQIRSLKATVASSILKGIYEPLSESSSLPVNIFGNLVLKIPLLFSGYAMNVVTTITGMQGADQMLAMFAAGRSNPKGIVGRMRAKLKGEEYVSVEGDTFDLSDVLEGVDLSRAFIRGAVTHTGLFAAGLMAGGLGLSGEDDESKKRRKMAEMQGIPYIYDPNRVENDFRNADALFLDWLPFNLGHYFQVTDEDAVGGSRDMVQLNWMLRQFFSPMMGMEKFFETGDFNQVIWGFQDAVGSFPIVNTMMFNDAVNTASTFAGQADKKQQTGDRTQLLEASGLLLNSVGVMERMLFESSFVNAIYVGRDEWDRDPYVLPLRDSDGTIQRDIEGLARAQNISVESYITKHRSALTHEIVEGDWQGQLYIDPDSGQIEQGYQSRSPGSATLHALTENRFTMALVSSLFTGLGSSDYWRQNMVPKIREFQKPTVTQDEAEAYILQAFKAPGAAGRMPSLTAEEIAPLIKADFEAKGIWWEEAEVMQMAEARARESRPAALSILMDGKEYLTKEGSRAVMQGLSKGSVHFGDPSLSGLYISREMRMSIQTEWMKEIVQEGVDLGLSESQATWRMRRVWNGPSDQPEILGLADLLWSPDISYSPDLKFQQHNTTYIMGPDGRPMATGWTRDGLFGALGLKPINTQIIPDTEDSLTGIDNRLNITYQGAGPHGMNTGLRGLELVDSSRYIPTDVEIGKSIEDAMKEAAAQTYTPQTPYSKKKGGSGWVNYGHRGYGGGYGGSSFSDGYANFSKMYGLPHARAPYGIDVPFINTTNPLIRRADVRRERVWSERGRLKQWE